MSFLFGMDTFLSPEAGEKEFQTLDFEVKKLEEMLKPLLDELKRKQARRDLLALVFNPHIVISEVNNTSMGHVYLGKVRIPPNTIYNSDSKPKFLNCYLGKFSQFNGKQDPALILLAKEKAKSIIQRKIFKLFI